MTIKDFIVDRCLPPHEREVEANRVEVFLTPSGIGSVIKIDGVAIPDVTKIVITAEVKQVTKIEITRWALNGISIEGEVGKVIQKPSNQEEPLMSDEFAR